MLVSYTKDIFRLQPQGGVSRYFTDLISIFAQSPDLGISPLRPWIYSSNLHALESGLAREFGFVENRSSVARVLRVPNHIANSGADILSALPKVRHGTNLRATRNFLRPGQLQVLTVFDLIPEKIAPSGTSRRAFAESRLGIRNADLILCISESTRNDLFEIHGEPECPVWVTRLGVSDFWSPHSLEERREDFFLYVGGRHSYKDFPTVLEAWSLMDANVALVCVGSEPFNSAERALIQEWGIGDRIHFRPAGDVELRKLYRRCVALVSASHHEGFGLPLVEAMACGTPIVVSRCEAHLEVAGDAGLFFPQGDVAALAEKLSELYVSESFRNNLKEMGLERSLQFKTRTVAEVTARAYQSLRPAEVGG